MQPTEKGLERGEKIERGREKRVQRGTGRALSGVSESDFLLAVAAAAASNLVEALGHSSGPAERAREKGERAQFRFKAKVELKMTMGGGEERKLGIGVVT
jgi:carbohydrate-selective porin OprB